ncbi:hypothetical protein [Microbacterium allomyrinae]|uniref:Uncharacterized protein n=1 Tax=Microbacterium allomyrinae TaxID=2830666 RepID=A0A9X1S2V3_9MICO|nr:hypothetical protein [Microbacterium allomyrinae]MCC2031827.1 hypothetical protein [Microbacterium allomyrinae]
MEGETVVVRRRTQTGTNRHNQPIYDWQPEDVDNVLVAPGPRADLGEDRRPDGTTIAWTLYFPKTFTGSLRGAQISVRGEPPAPVIGDPKPYPDDTPTEWNMPVELERTDG